jgi:integrase
MASIISDPGGRKRIQFTNGYGMRKTVRLGHATMQQAHEVKLHVQRLLLDSLDEETTRWTQRIPDQLHKRLANVGIVKPREATRLSPWLERYLESRRQELKPGSLANLDLTRQKLLQYFEAQTPLRAITPDEAAEWRQWLRTGDATHAPLSEATTRHHVGNAKGFFNEARRRELVSSSPFEHLAGGTAAATNDRYVTPEEARAVIDACPDLRFKVLFALARHAGLRTPSETHLLTWSDVDWVESRLNVRSPKTEHHAGHEKRWVPIVPELHKLLQEALTQAPKGQTQIVTIQPGGYMNRKMRAYIQHADVAPWPRLWQALRSSCEKEWAMSFPQYAVSKWIGHSITVSGRHYANDVPMVLYAKAAQVAIPAAQIQVQNGGNLTETTPSPKQKRPDFPGISATPPTLPIGATGFEPGALTSPGKRYQRRDTSAKRRPLLSKVPNRSWPLHSLGNRRVTMNVGRFSHITHPDAPRRASRISLLFRGKP